MGWVERRGRGVGTGEVVETEVSGFRKAKEFDWKRRGRRRNVRSRRNGY